MSDLVGNPEDRFSRVEAQIILKPMQLNKATSIEVFLCNEILGIMHVRAPYTHVSKNAFCKLGNKKISSATFLLSFL